MRLAIGLACCAPALVAGCYASHTRSSESDGGPLEEPGYCVIPAASCAADADCGDTRGWACRSGRCAFVGCEGDAECPAGWSCVRTSSVGRCVQRCRVTRPDCAVISSTEGPTVCREGLCQSDGCPSADWCRDYARRGRWRCEPDRWNGLSPELPVCRAICERDSDCEGGLFACIDGYCRSRPCRSDGECRARTDDERMQCRPRS
jgi:hypothetical protein